MYQVEKVVKKDSLWKRFGKKALIVGGAATGIIAGVIFLARRGDDEEEFPIEDEEVEFSLTDVATDVTEE